MSDLYDLCEKIQSNIGKNLLISLRVQADEKARLENDKKVAAIHALQQELSSSAVVVDLDAITTAIKSSLRSSNQSVSSASLSLLSTYIPLLDTSHSVRQLILSITLPTLEKLGDQKDRVRQIARSSIISLGHSAYKVSGALLSASNNGKETPLGIFERLLCENGLTAKMARIREQSVLVLSCLRELCEKYPVKPLMPVMVDLLGDADAAVRETAKTTLIGLFMDATPGAKAELKKELEKKVVRKQTIESILSHILTTPEETSSQSSVQGNEEIKPVYIASRSDLEATFTTFLPFYQGKETEHNWLQREQSMIKIRGMLKACAHTQFSPSFFVSCVKSVQEGILKALASLRTTLSMHAISLISELAQCLNDDFVPLVEVCLPALMRMAGFTKKLVANATQEAAATIMLHVSYRHLYLSLIWQGIQEKNVQTRVFASEHMATLLSHPRKHAMESHGGLETLKNTLKKGLTDQNPGVRANTRQAFWRFYKIWNTEGKVMVEKMEASIKKQVMASAPNDLEEVPKPSGIPARRPAGLSVALLAARRAAAQEKERQEAHQAGTTKVARRMPSVAQVPLAQSPGDETIQLPAFGDVSVDLMTFSSSPVKGSMADESLVFHTPMPVRGAQKEEGTRQPIKRSPSPCTPQPQRTSSSPTHLGPIPSKSAQWLVSKSDRLSSTPFSSPCKPDLTSLSSGSADLRTFRRLAKISCETISLSDFKCLWNAVTRYLSDAPVGDMRTAALVLLHRLVSFQYQHLVQSGLESELLQLALQGKDRASMGVLETWCAKVDPVLGFSSLAGYGLTKPSLMAFALIITKLPKEVVADQLPRLAEKLVAALSDSDVEVRQGAVSLLVAAQRQCGSVAILDSLGSLDAQKQDLLMYYFSKT